MKLLYGVVGEGMGHATRSSVILRHLLDRGHEVRVVVSGRAAEYLDKYFPNVERIEGLSMTFEGNRLDKSQTVWNFLKGLPKMLGDNFEQFVSIGESFAADAVISDFETFSYLFGKHHDLPVISIDNMQVINRCKLEVEIPDEDYGAYLIAKNLVKGKLPGCHHYLVTSFFFPPVRKADTSLYPPILRQKVLDAPTSVGEHLLVYQTTTTNERLLEVLRKLDVPCRVYGLHKDETIGKIELKGFSEDGFISDLASARGVLATGGFSLMGEAIYLRKPLLAVPLSGQFEQALNCLYLDKLGYGEMYRELTVEGARHFVSHLDDYAGALASFSQDGNRRILTALDELLANLR
jgi:uncharacterized protein (TIGR00661 family)